MGINALGNGTDTKWFWLEVAANFLQPMLLVLGMTRVPLDMKWWGNTTLGCYAFHFYFKDQMCIIIQTVCQALAWDPTGVLLLFSIIGMCIIFTSIVGPISHFFLISPILLRCNLSSYLKAIFRTKGLTRR